MAAKNPLHPIPHPPKTLLLGNLMALGTTTPVQDMVKLAREYGPIYWLDMMGKPVVIYEAELAAFAAQGVTRLHGCFSRVPGQDKTYVQHAVLGNTSEVWRMIQDEAVIYVCGDASRMAPDVQRAFAGVCQVATGADEPATERWLDEMAAAGRYLVDVWAAS
ncbi:MAG TPA: cytochrome P450 [Candidatus Binatia bacterium]|nr:cytochrome P450 [Candidatus Binatia bacterium]